MKTIKHGMNIQHELGLNTEFHQSPLQLQDYIKEKRNNTKKKKSAEEKKNCVCFQQQLKSTVCIYHF